MAAAAAIGDTVDYPDGVTAIDTEYWRPRLAASHLIVERGRGAFVDTGTTHSVEPLLRGLAAKGLAPGDVDYIFLTHIHLDHAGGAGALAARLPNAKVVVHKRGAPHLIDPTRLTAGTRNVYGEERYARLYGEIVPIPAERVVTTNDGDTLELAGRRFEFLHTPGHSLDHHVIVDHGANTMFTGDTFGLSYREFDVGGRPWVMATTTPTHFDPDQMHASIDRIVAVRPTAVYMTHYGRVPDVERLGRALHEGVDAYVAIARRNAQAPDRESRIREEMFEWLSGTLDAHGYQGSLAERHRLLDPDIGLNEQGLIVWLNRRA